MATRLDIRTRARIRADQDSSTFPTDDQYNLLIDESAKDVWYDLVQAGWPIGYNTASATFTGFARFIDDLGVDASIPVAFVRGVFVRQGSCVYELRRLNEGDRARLMSANHNQPTHYEVVVHPTEGLTVYTFPPTASGLFDIQYVPEWPGFTDDADTWVGPARSDELIVLRAAAKGCRKEGNDQGANQLDKEYTVLLEKVQQMASWVDMRNPPVISDVEFNRIRYDLSEYDY